MECITYVVKAGIFCRMMVNFIFIFQDGKEIKYLIYEALSYTKNKNIVSVTGITHFGFCWTSYCCRLHIYAFCYPKMYSQIWPSCGKTSHLSPNMCFGPSCEKSCKIHENYSFLDAVPSVPTHRNFFSDVACVKQLWTLKFRSLKSNQFNFILKKSMVLTFTSLSWCL